MKTTVGKLRNQTSVDYGLGWGRSGGLVDWLWMLGGISVLYGFITIPIGSMVLVYMLAFGVY